MRRHKAARSTGHKTRKPHVPSAKTVKREASTGLLEFHPLADIDPLMEGADFEALVENIRLHGLHEPIVLYRGKILDGRNRARACAEAEKKPKYSDRKFRDNAEAKDYLDSANWYRRHLTPEQKNERIAARLKANPTLSNRQVAKQTSASHPHVAKVRHKLEKSGQLETVSSSIGIDGRTRTRQRSKLKVKLAKAKSVGGVATSTTEPLTQPTATAGNSRTSAPTTETPSRDASPYSVGECDRLRSRVDELNTENRRLQIVIGGLESEIAELKEINAGLKEHVAKLTAPAVAPTTDPIGADLDVQDFADGSLRR